MNTKRRIISGVLAVIMIAAIGVFAGFSMGSEAIAMNHPGGVTFDPNGGTGGPGTVTMTLREDSSAGWSMIRSGTVPEDVPTREGFTFMGWSMANDGTPDFQPGDVIDSSYGLYFIKEYLVYAIWEEAIPDYSELIFTSNPISDGTIIYAA